jgi:ribosomal protein L36
MKKLIFIGLLATLAFGYDSKTTFKRADSNEVPNTIHVYGIVTDTSEWHYELEVEIDMTNGNTIKGITSASSRIRRNDRVRGICSNYKNRKYRNCSLSIY